MSRKNILLCCACLFSLGILASPVSAHALRISCKIKEDRVEIQAKFDDGTVARKAKVQVETLDEEQIHQGQTDGEGKWFFPLPKPGRYRVRVNSGGGHLASLKLTINEPSAESENKLATMEVEATDPSHHSWLKIGIGIGAICLLSLGLFVATINNRRKKRAEKGK